MKTKMKAQETCSACGEAAEAVRGDYRYVESGLKNVTLSDIELIRCPHCGNVDPIIQRISDLHRALALAIIGQPFRLQGEDVRYLRKYLGLPQDQFAELLHVHKTNLSKWENGQDKIGKQSDRLIRTVALALGEGLEKQARQVVRAFPAIRSTVRRRIEVNLLNEQGYAAKVA